MEATNENIFDFDSYEEEENQAQQEPELDLFNENDSPEEEQEEPENEEPQEQEDFLTTFLKAKGFNRKAISIENEDGEVEEVDFDSLTDEEKLYILNSSESQSLTDDEIETINSLRKNKMSLKDYTAWQREEAVKDYLSKAQTPSYKVDQLSDEDLYKFDLMEKYPDMTEDEVAEEVELAKTNESLFNKKIAALRKEYTELEDEQTKYAEQQAQEEYEAQYNQLAESLVNVARGINDLHDLVVEDEDKDAVLSTLLDRDANGQSEFYKYLEDPEALFKMAWYMKYGDQAFQSITDYYKGVIEKSRRQTPAQPRTVRKPQATEEKTDVFDLEGQLKNIK